LLVLTTSKDSNSVTKSTTVKDSQDEFFLEEYDNVSEIKETDDESNIDYQIDLTLDELSNRMHMEKDEVMKDFYLRQLSKITHDQDIFTNKKFLSELSQLSSQNQILIIYKKNFEKMKDFIDNLYKLLIDNVSAIPYSLRCICKIISVLIYRKVIITSLQHNINNYKHILVSRH